MWPARKKASKLVLLFFYIFLVALLVLRTVAIPYRPYSIYKHLYGLCIDPAASHIFRAELTT